MGAVIVDYAKMDQGRISYAQGTVAGDHGKYVVTCEPDGDHCDCVFGLNQPGHSHSHTLALRLAVWNQARQKETQ
jgi:hypothetical protein